jgi:hypothetical protein
VLGAVVLVVIVLVMLHNFLLVLLTPLRLALVEMEQVLAEIMETLVPIPFLVQQHPLVEDEALPEVQVVGLLEVVAQAVVLVMMRGQWLVVQVIHLAQAHLKVTTVEVLIQWVAVVVAHLPLEEIQQA